jgi:lyso-ornithine lipid O-acyltransferase
LRASLRAGLRSGVTVFEVFAAIGSMRQAPRLGEPSAVAVRTAAIGSCCRRMCAVHDFRVDVAGAVPAGPAVLVANHVSYIDPLVIAQVAPSIPICKGEVAGWPLIGGAMTGLGVLFVRRDDVYSGAVTLRAAARVLDSGGCVLNFPEGTTTDGRTLLPFRRGIFGLAGHLGVPVIPVGVTYDSASLAWTGNESFIPHYWRTAARARSGARVGFGGPIVARGRPAELVAAEARASVQALVQGATHHATDRIRVPAPRPDAVFSAAVG